MTNGHIFRWKFSNSNNNFSVNESSKKNVRRSWKFWKSMNAQDFLSLHFPLLLNKCFSKGSWRSDSNLIVWFFDNRAQLSLPVITKRCSLGNEDETLPAEASRPIFSQQCWEEKKILALSLGLNYAGKRKVPPGLKQVHCGYRSWTQHFDHRGYVGF